MALLVLSTIKLCDGMSLLSNCSSLLTRVTLPDKVTLVNWCGLRVLNNSLRRLALLPYYLPPGSAVSWLS